MIRTFIDYLKQPHTLDLDAVLVDSVRCISVQATEQYVQFELETGIAVTCELGQFWREVAGPDLSAQEAGLLLVDCLVRQVMLQRMSAGLHEAMGGLARATALPAEIPSAGWLTTRIDPLAAKAMAAYDGTPEMTDILARILQREPTTIQMWARQLGLDAPTQAEDAAASPVEVKTEPLLAPVAVERKPAELVAAKPQFRWTSERLQQLEAALATCTGTTVIERARQIAYEYDWPVLAVRSKLYEMQRPRRDDAREAERTKQPQEQSGVEEVASKGEAIACSDPVADRAQPISSGPVPLTRGSFLWTVLSGAQTHRWALDYPYGTFPFRAGQRCLYGSSVYQIEDVGTSQLRVAIGGEQSASHLHAGEQPSYAARGSDWQQGGGRG